VLELGTGVSTPAVQGLREQTIELFRFHAPS
jgi:hypothetical protein